MVRHYVDIFVYVLVLSVICEKQSDGVFIVYPFKEGDINESKAKHFGTKFEVRRDPKMLNDPNVHLVYPTNEDVIIMTPASIFGKESETLDSYTEAVDFDLRSKEESEYREITSGDTDSTTIDPSVIETPLHIQKSTDQEPSLADIIYEETGPMKTLRKRMFEATKFSRKYPSGLKMINDIKIPTTMSPKDAFKNWYRKTSRNKALTFSEKGKKFK